MIKAACTSFGVLALVLSSLALPADAQDKYPSSPVKVIYGFAPGGGGDVVARLLAQKLSEQMNANFFVENKPGANSNIAADFIAKSKPDGYTLLLNTSSLILSPLFGDKLSYDLFTDLAPVAMVSSAPMVIFTSPSVPANTPAEFIAHLKANPGKLAYGSSGAGGITHLGAELFLQANGVSALHVPYKGANAVIVDVVGERIQFGMQTPLSVLPMAKDNRIKLIAATGMKRAPLLPNVPTLNETIMPRFELVVWYGMLGPAKMPPEIVKTLNGEIAKALKDPATISRLAQEGMEPLTTTPEEYGAYMKREFQRWENIVKTSGIKLQ